MQHELLFAIDTRFVTAAVLLVAIALSEAGFLLGRRKISGLEGVAATGDGALHGALLGLLGLLLAFTLSMSVSRYEHRRDVMIEEVDAIGTVWLRAGFLPHPAREDVRSALAHYATTRLEVFDAPPSRSTAESRAMGGEICDRMWTDVLAVADSDTRSIPAGLLVQALNQLIDLKTTREIVHASHVPEPIWWLLIAIILVVMASMGFNDAERRRRNLVGRIALAAALSFTLALALDLDRPSRGVIRVSPQPMIDLIESFER